MKIEVGKTYWVKTDYSNPFKAKVLTIVRKGFYSQYQASFGIGNSNDSWFDKSDFICEVKEGQ